MPNMEAPIKCSSCWPDEWCLGTPNAHIRHFLVLIIRVLFSWTRESEDGRLCEDHKFPPVTRCSAFCLSEGLRKNCWTDSSERWQMGEGRIHQILREQWGKRVSRTSFIQDFKKINQGSALWDASTVDRCCSNLIEENTEFVDNGVSFIVCLIARRHVILFWLFQSLMNFAGRGSYDPKNIPLDRDLHLNPGSWTLESWLFLKAFYLL